MENDEPSQQGGEAVAAAPPHGASAGAVLANARKTLGMGVFEVSHKLHLTEHYVRALEADDYSKLPGEVFVKGYLKSYALLVGLDPDQVRGYYRRPSAAVEHERETVRQQPARFSQNWLVLLLLLVTLAVVLGAAGWWAWQTYAAAFVLAPLAVKGDQAGTSGESAR